MSGCRSPHRPIWDAGPYPRVASSGKLARAVRTAFRPRKRVMPSRSHRSSRLAAAAFSMERDSSLLDDYVLALTGAAADRGSASCRPPPATPTTTWCASTGASRAVRRQPRLALPSRPGRRGVEDDLAIAPARPGPHLRRRRQRGEHARRRGARTASTRSCAEAWRRGIVLCGPSAGSLCWFAAGA